MIWSRKFRAGIRIALTISLFWTVAFVVLRAGIGLPSGGLTLAEFVEWFRTQIVGILGTGLLLGSLFASGLALMHRKTDASRLTGRRSIGVGALGGCVVAIVVMAYYGFSPYVGFLWEAVVPALAITSIGALTGFGVWRTIRHAELVDGEAQPELLKP